jgi:hypothetical protein
VQNKHLPITAYTASVESWPEYGASKIMYIAKKKWIFTKHKAACIMPYIKSYPG